MELKDALTAWKKAKPLLLTKTGVSEMLRQLPKNPAIVENFKKEIPLLENTKKALATAIADKRIAKHTKAIACLKEILVATDKQLQAHKLLRGKLNDCYKIIFNGGHAFVKAPSSQNLNVILKAIDQTDALFKQMQPEDPMIFQVPTRIGTLAETVMQHHGKAGKEKALQGAMNEMSNYMKRYPMMAA